MRKTMLSALAVLLPCTMAHAAAVGAIPVGPTGVSGTIHAGEMQPWTLDLERGRVYALAAQSDCGAGVPVATLRDPAGRLLATAQAACDSDGGTFRAPATATYAVAVQGDGNRPPAEDQNYQLVADHDCPASAATACGIAVGATLHGLKITYATDHDWFRTNLRGGRTYVLRATGAADELLLLDGRGRVLVDVVGGPGDPPALTARAPASGTYYVEALQAEAEDPGSYDLSLDLAP